MTQIHSSGLWAAPWLLLVLPLLLRALPWGRGEAEWAPSWRIDLPLALVVSVAMAALCSAELSLPLTEYFPISSSDFDQYCELTARVAEGDMIDYRGVRMTAPAWLPAMASRHLGLIDGLALQSFLALVVVCGGLYLWGLALHSRLAGLCAALLVGSVGPMAFLARDLSFYPVVVAGSVALAAAVTASARFRGAWPALLVGLSACGLLLSDVRGVLFAAPLVGLGLLFALVRARTWKGALVRLGLVFFPVLLSWFVAGAVVPQGTTGLERQAVMYADQAVANAGGSPSLLAQQRNTTLHDSGFVWGHRSIAALPGTFLFLRQLTDRIPAEVRGSEQNQRLRARHLRPWAVPGVVALCLCLTGLGRRPWRLLSLVLSAAPFLAMLWATGQVLPQERHLATALAVLPLIMGVAVAVLAEGAPSLGPRADAPARRWLPWRRALLLGAVLAGMMGWPPTWLGHWAGWRQGIVQSEPRTMLQQLSRGQSLGDSHCVRALERDMDQPWWPSRFYPRAHRVLDGSDPWAPD